MHVAGPRSTAMLVAAVAVVGLCTLASTARAEGEQPNILLFLLDDVGADRFSFYGSSVDSSPNINELAEKGTVFNSFFAQPICGPSRACLMSGRYTSNTEVYGNGHRLNDVFDESECTLGSTFQGTGYHTAIFGKLHPEQPYQDSLNTSCGFDKYAIWARSGPRYHNSTIVTNIGNGDLSYNELVEAARSTVSPSVPRLTTMSDTYHPHLNRELAKAHITASKAAGSPFFILMSMLLTHGPTPDKEKDPSVPSDMAGETDSIALFNQRLRLADAVIGDVLRHLEVEGLDQNTIVAVLGDNGSPRGVNAVVNGVPTRNGKRWADRSEGTRVPLVMYYPPAQAEAPSRVGSVVNIYDVLPSLAEAAGINEYPAGKDAPDGRSFWRLFTGQRRRRSQWSLLFSSTRRPHAVMRNRKFILTSDGTVMKERKWYKPREIGPGLVCRKRKILRRLRKLVGEAWKLGINVTLPGSDTAYPPNACDKIACNTNTGLPECVLV